MMPAAYDDGAAFPICRSNANEYSTYYRRAAENRRDRRPSCRAEMLLALQTFDQLTQRVSHETAHRISLS
jgi:hypothetical protein